MAHRQLRSVRLGEHLNMLFESVLTIRYQIQEILHVEKQFEEQGILDEIAAYATSDEDLERETDAKTSAVHFCRFEFNEAMKKAIKYGAVVKLGYNPPSYNVSVVIPLNQLESLQEDLN